MKNDVGTVVLSGNVPSEAVKCKINEAGFGHLMSILSNMYEDKFLAVLREYWANARDSHVEAGQTRPVEVTLPSALQPNLTIRDFGVGLTKEGVFDIFGQYCNSTKGETNDQVGMLGIGSKSAFTMGQQFVVTAVKDGQRTVVLFSLDEGGNPTMTPMSETPTDEPNGVTVSLAVTDTHRMKETARRFFATVPAGTTLVNGTEPDHVYDEDKGAVWFSDTVYRNTRADDRFYLDVNYVVMGGVAYRISDSLWAKVPHPKADLFRHWGMDGWFFEVPIGSVSIAPDREGLRDTSKTINTLAAAIEDLCSVAQRKAEEAVAAATTWREAHETFLRWKEGGDGSLLALHDLKWNGKDLGTSAKVLTTVCYLYHKSRGGGKWHLGVQKNGATVNLNTATKTAVVVVSDDDRPRVSRFARRFMEDKGLELLVLTPDAKGGFDWFEWGPGHPVEVITFEDFQTHMKSLRAPRGSKPKVTIPCYAVGHHGADISLDSRTPLDEIVDDGETLIYWESDVRGRYDQMIFDGIASRGKEITLLATQNVESLHKALDGLGLDVTVRRGYEVAAEVTKALVNSLTDDQKELVGQRAAVQQYREREWHEVRKVVERSTVELLNDEITTLFTDFDDAQRSLNAHTDKEVSEAERLARLAGASIKPAFEVLDRSRLYPLLPSYWYSASRNQSTCDHVVMYLNGVALSQPDLAAAV